MSSVSSVSPNLNPYQTGSATSFKQIKQDFNALASALQSGDVAGAQQAFAALQKDDPKIAAALKQAGSSTSTNSAAGTALGNLGAALQSGDIAGAKQAFAALQQTRHGHHHHGHGTEAVPPPVADTATTDTTTAATSTDSGGGTDGSQPAGLDAVA